MTGGRPSRGYIESSVLFGWVVFIAIFGMVAYYGDTLYLAYSQGYDRGHQDGMTFVSSGGAQLHGRVFQNAKADFIEEHRSKYHERTMRDKAFVYGWDAGFHDVTDKLLNT